MLTAQQKHQCHLIDNLDLEPIAFKLVYPELGETGMSVQEADQLVIKYRRFLQLCAMYPEQGIVPSKEIDKVWHNHILDTAKYEKDCRAIFGFMLHHFPYLGMRGEADEELLRKKGAETRALYKQHFGEDMYGGNIENIDAAVAVCGDVAGCDVTSDDPDHPRLVRA